MRTLFSVILIISWLSGCAKKATDKVVVADNTIIISDTTKVPDTLTYLALGDSYTIGQSVPLNESFPYQLSKLLGLRSDPAIIATTGWTTKDLIDGIDNSDIKNKTYDFVTLLIGVNDQYQRLDQAGYRSRFITLLNTAIKFARGDKSRVFVISIPDYSVTPYAAGSNTVMIAKEVDEFNTINNTESDKAGVNYLNITDISRQAGTDGTLLADDGLHPSAKMYGLWVRRLLPLVKAKVAN